jgi:hypothetical protein
MIILKQSTASQEVLLGPFLDDVDGKTQKTALTIANTDIKIWKAGGTTESNKNSGGATHIANGRYYAVLDATDTDTLGPLEVNIHVTGALPVRRECLVVTAARYDQITGTTAPLTATTIADGVLTRPISTLAATIKSNPKCLGGVVTVLMHTWKVVSGVIKWKDEAGAYDGTNSLSRSITATDSTANPISENGDLS